MPIKIITGGQSGVDRAALDVAIARGMAYGGWCPRGGWAEDFPQPPGVLRNYPLLRETPLSDPAQRTEWNIRDSHAIWIITDAAGLRTSNGSELARSLAEKYDRPVRVSDAGNSHEAGAAAEWIRSQTVQGEVLALGVGGPRESEAPGIYAAALNFLQAVFDHIGGTPVDYG